MRSSGKRALFAGISILMFIACIIAGEKPAACEAANITQKLDKNASKVAFDMMLGMMQANGTLNDIDGILSVDPNNLSSAKVVFQTSPADISLSTMGQQNLLLEKLIESIPGGNVRFDSTNVVHISGNRYKVSGVVTRGSEKRNISFPVEIALSTPARSLVRATLHGDGYQLIPSAGAAGVVKGDVKVELVFRR